MCWRHAIPGLLRGRRRYLIIRGSDYIKFGPFTMFGKQFTLRLPHMMLADDISHVVVEEYRPYGCKKHGWRGIWHALRSEWHVDVHKGDD